VRRRNEYRGSSGIGRNVERVLGQAQQEVCACSAAAQQFVSRRRIDADRKAVRPQRLDCVLEMGERRVRRQPTSITSAPAARMVVARSRIWSTVSADASTISEKMRMS